MGRRGVNFNRWPQNWPQRLHLSAVSWWTKAQTSILRSSIMQVLSRSQMPFHLSERTLLAVATDPKLTHGISIHSLGGLSLSLSPFSPSYRLSHIFSRGRA